MLPLDASWLADHFPGAISSVTLIPAPNQSKTMVFDNVWQKCLDENYTFLTCLEQTVPTKMTVMTVGSFHVLGKKLVWHGIYQSISRFYDFSWFSTFICKRLVSEGFEAWGQVLTVRTPRQAWLGNGGIRGRQSNFFAISIRNSNTIWHLGEPILGVGGTGSRMWGNRLPWPGEPLARDTLYDISSWL